MNKLQHHTIQQYLDVLSARAPVPGGGSVSALTGALACGLLAMVIEYSLGRKQTKAIEGKFARLLKEIQGIREEFLVLVDEDAVAYLKVRAAAQAGVKEKKAAQRGAAAVQKKVARLCYKAIKVAPYLVEKGNPYLRADIEVALDLLLAAFNGAQRLLKA